MTYSQFLGNCLAKIAKHDRKAPERKGQMCMNDLFEVRPDLAKVITLDFPGIDPYYLDANIPDFFSWLADHW